MTRFLAWSAAAAAACSVALFISPAGAQSSAGAQSKEPDCGGARWSQAQMRYIQVPCTADATTSADGKPTCGGARWSQAQMRYVQVPCTAEATKTADGKASCGGARWSQAQMRYVQVPCAHR